MDQMDENEIRRTQEALARITLSPVEEPLRSIPSRSQSYTEGSPSREEPSRLPPKKSKPGSAMRSSTRSKRKETQRQLKESALSQMLMSMPPERIPDEAPSRTKRSVSRSRSTLGLPRSPASRSSMPGQTLLQQRIERSAPPKLPLAVDDEASRASLSSRASSKRGRIRRCRSSDAASLASGSASVGSMSAFTKSTSSKRSQRKRSTSSSRKRSSSRPDAASVTSGPASVGSMSASVASTKSSSSERSQRKRSTSRSRRKRSSSRKPSERVKGDCAPVSPRKLPSPTQDEEQQQQHTQQDGRWESDKMEPSEPQEVTPSVISAAREPSRTSSTVISSSTIKRVSRNSHPGIKKIRSKRMVRCSSDSALKTATEAAADAHGQKPGLLPPTDPREGRETVDQQAPNPAFDPSVDAEPKKKSKRTNLVSRLGRSLSLNSRKVASTARASKKKSESKGSKTGRYLEKIGLMSSKYPDDSTVQSFTEHTVSTVGTELSELSTLSGSDNIPAPLARTYSKRSSTSNTFGRLLSRLRADADKSSASEEGQLASEEAARETRRVAVNKSLMMNHFESNMIPNETTKADGDEDSTFVSHMDAIDQNAVMLGASTASRSAPKKTKSSSSKKKRSKKKKKSFAWSPSSSGKNVSFGSVAIREYERCVGDNPAVSSGPPIGLDWAYTNTLKVLVDDYETGVRKPGPRTRKEFFLTPQKRFHILLDEWNFTVQEICRAKDQASEIRLQRQVSIFGDGAVPQLQANIKMMPFATKRKASGKLPKMPKAQSRWDTSCPAVAHDSVGVSSDLNPHDIDQQSSIIST